MCAKQAEDELARRGAIMFYRDKLNIPAIKIEGFENLKFGTFRIDGHVIDIEGSFRFEQEIIERNGWDRYLPCKPRAAPFMTIVGNDRGDAGELRALGREKADSFAAPGKNAFTGDVTGPVLPD